MAIYKWSTEPTNIYNWSNPLSEIYKSSTKVRPTSISPYPTDWLIAYYPFDSDMNDHKADLWVSWTTYNCTAWGGYYSYVTWKVDSCIYQSRGGGSGRAVNTGINVWNVFSLSVWFKLVSTSWWQVIGGNQARDEGVWFRRQFDNWGLSTWIKAVLYSTWITLSADTWYQYTITQNETELKQYVNGDLRATDTIDSTAWATTLRLLWRWDWYWTPCYMDDVLVYNRILTDIEISNYYAATA